MGRITAFLVISLLAGTAQAQDVVTAADATARTQQALAAIDPSLSCLEAKRRELRTNLQLIREAEAQRTSSSASAAARRDAEVTLRALADRAAQLEIEGRACLGATTAVAPRTVTTQRLSSGATTITTTTRATSTTATV